jgi:cytochrome d ubiquinol oxidase subunit II
MWPQYAHNMGGAVVCGAFVMAGLGAFYVLGRRHEEYGRIFLKVGVIAGLLASLWMLFPSGHFSSEQVAEHQPVSLAAMEGLFESERQAGVVLIGQPDVENRSIDNPIVVPRALSYLVYQNWNAEVKGLDAFPQKKWPDNIPLLYYSYHVMVGLGTIFIAIMVVAAFLLWRGRLYGSRWVLWLLMIRGLSIELRGHINDPMWASFWDAAFFVGSSLLAVFYGAALGNVVRGVPLDESGYFFQPLWTDFSPFSGTPGILDWYTVLIGLLALTTLVVHGSNFIAVKTEHDLNARSRRIARRFSFATVLLTGLATPATFWVSPEMLRSFNERPYGYVLPLVAVAGLVGMVYFDLRGRDREAFLSSSAYIVGMLTSTVFGVYPNVLPAVDPANSLTIYNASASTYGMKVGLVWWSIGIVLAAVYFTLIYRLFRGKVRL